MMDGSKLWVARAVPSGLVPDPSRQVDLELVVDYLSATGSVDALVALVGPDCKEWVLGASRWVSDLFAEQLAKAKDSFAEVMDAARSDPTWRVSDPRKAFGYAAYGREDARVLWALWELEPVDALLWERVRAKVRALSPKQVRALPVHVRSTQTHEL